MVTGRFDLNPLGEVKMDEAGWPSDKPLVNVGGSFAWNKVGANDVGSGFDRDNDVMDVALGLDGLTAPGFNAAYGSDLAWLLWTANLNATWMGATFAAEYYDLNADPDLGDDWDADGLYVQVGYQVIPKKLELAARYSEIKSDDTKRIGLLRQVGDPARCQLLLRQAQPQAADRLHHGRGRPDR
jgi:hypothetical protein